jgi:hypothetical protein
MRCSGPPLAAVKEWAMSIDVNKFANAETRHPHKEILECLVQFIEVDGEVPMHPSVPRDFIVGSSDRYDELKKFSTELLEEAVDDLIEAYVVEERDDLHAGWRTLGVRELIEAAEAPYEDLKERVYQKAKAVGLWPKWRPSDGWLLVNGGDQVVFEGPMSALNEYLDHTSSAVRG